MAAVEGIQDQVADVIQKHVPQDSHNDKSPKAALSNGETNENRMEIDNELLENSHEMVSQSAYSKDISSQSDVDMVNKCNHDSNSKILSPTEAEYEMQVDKNYMSRTIYDKKSQDMDVAMDSDHHTDSNVIINQDNEKNNKSITNDKISNGIPSRKFDECFAPVNENTDSSAVKNSLDIETFKSLDQSLVGAECLKQERLFEKLGFNPVRNFAVDSICNSKDAEVQEANLNSDVLRPEIMRNTAQENAENLSNVSSKCSSPCSIVNGVTADNEKRRSNRILEQKSLVNSLKEDLRYEETKLLLLRKLVDSHASRKNSSISMHKVKESGSRHMNMPSLQPKNRVPGHVYSGSQQDANSSVHIAPKIVMGSKGSSAGPNLPRVVPSIVPSGKSGSGSAVASNADAPHVTHAQMHTGVPVTTIMTQPVHKYYIQVGSQLVPAAPPTCINQPVYAMPVYSNTTSVCTKSKVVSTTASSVSLPKLPNQTLNSSDSQASKHSAAKAALRRQLEQTLLQIPPPRPPAADWTVIPNVNSMDFMMLVGLDEIVDMILECDGKPTLKRILTDMLPVNPIICNQCGMDFSPLWKPKGFEKPSDVLCEKCSLMNTKKDLKAEHTSRLKSAFLKALKQEQEIEEKIKAGEDVHIGSPPLSDKDIQSAAASHHKSQGHLHSIHQPYKHQKVQKNSNEHHRPVVHHHHHHGVVQHYPHHSSLVHQLHQQHVQQQQLDYDQPSSSSRRNTRWYPYVPSHHHGSSHVHGASHHRNYTGSASGRSDGRHEYYVVHHPQHSNSATRWGH